MSKPLLCVSVVSLACAISALAAPDSHASLERAGTALARVPLHFEANQGQYRPQVRYAAHHGGATVLLTEKGPILASRGRRVGISLRQSNRASQIEPLEPLVSHTDYFIGRNQNWHTGVAHYERVAYRDVYPGIDVVYYGSGDRLEYDFLLRPGADPRRIQLQFRGADSLRITPAGDLEVSAGDTHLTEKRPLIYQTDPKTGSRVPVAGAYALVDRETAAIRLGHYDRTRALVIDPVVEYGTFVGGSASDVVTAVKSDAKGLLYIVGYTYNSDLAYTPGASQVSNNGGIDTFAAVIDPRVSGPNSLQYLTYLGGGRDDQPTALTLDGAGNMYIAGTTTSSDFPLNGNSVQTTLHLSTTQTVFLPDAFVAVVSPNNPVAYSTYYGGTGADTPNGIALDAGGNIYVVGTTTSTDLAVTDNAYQSVSWGPADVFFLKLDPNSTTPAYASYLGGESAEDGRSIAVAPNGLVYFAASTLSTYFPTAGQAYQGSLLGLENLIIGVMDMRKSGFDSLLYSTYFGGTTLDEVRGIALDAKGRLLLTGWTLSTDFPVTANAMQPTAPGNGDIFVTRVNPLGPSNQFLDYSTYVGGTDGDVAYDIAADASGAIYLTGYTLSTDFPVTKDAVQPAFASGIEAFLLKFDPAVAGKGALVYGTYFGGTGVHVGNSVALAPDGSMYVGGYTTPDLQFTSTGYQGGFNGGYTDGFVFAVK